MQIRGFYHQTGFQKLSEGINESWTQE